MSSSSYPSLSFENQLFEAGYDFIVGVDEVGRGALAGPVTVGLAVVSVEQLRQRPNWPAKLRDSKLISESNRELIFPDVCDWVVAYGVASASAQEVDELGIVRTLALSAERASQDIIDVSNPGHGVVLLDGSHNWLGSQFMGLQVMVKTKADRDCVSVAAASVIAKVTRDREMIRLAASDEKVAAFGFDSNKGYASSSHIKAIQEIGPSEYHRRTWLSKILDQDTLF